MNYIEACLFIFLFIFIFSINIKLSINYKYWKYFNYITIIGSVYILISGYIFYLEDMEYIRENNIEDIFAGITFLIGLYFLLLTNFIILIINLIRPYKILIK